MDAVDARPKEDWQFKLDSRDVRESSSNRLSSALAVCDDKIQVFVDWLYACLVGSGFEDADGDDEHGPGDHCPNTPALAPVDDAGCSLEQFCAVQGDVCEAADWRNDQPKGRPRDCARVGSKRSGYTCHADARRRNGT